MPETVYRESRSYVRERDDHSSDDDRYSRAPTVRRYKVTTRERAPAPPPPPPVEVERVIERDYVDVDDDRRSRFSNHTHHLHPGRSSGDLIEVDTTRRVYLPERPRSAFEPPARNTTVVEKVVERERERSPVQDFYDVTRRSTVKDDGRTVVYEKTKEVEREDPYPRPPSNHSRTVVEKKVVEREREDDRWFDDRDRRTVVEKKVVERERERDDDRWFDDRDRARTVIEKREKVVERDDDRHWDDRGGGAVVYEKTKEIERERGPTTPRSPSEWGRHSHSPWDRDNVDVRLERRVERRDDGVDVTIQRRTEERRDETPHGEYSQYRRETEYFEPPPPDPAPIIIRQRAPEQRIIVQEAPEPAPIVVPYRQQSREMVVARRPDPRDEEDYYYRRREIERYDGRRDRDEDYAIYRRGGGRDRERYEDGYGSDDDVYVRRTIIRRERSKSPDHHHRLHLAEGAVAGAGLAALAASRPREGQYASGRGRKVLAGAALGALGTEVFKRARSAYNEHYGEDDRHHDDRGGRGRSRSRRGHRSGDEEDGDDDDDKKKDKHSRIKTGLGLAAAALAVAGAAKYYQTQKIEKEELRRGRSRNRRGGYSDSDDSYYGRSPSRGPGPRSPSRGGGGAGGIAKAAAGTAAVAGLVQHYRSKSRQRKDGGGKANNSKSRSQSRLRTGAEIVAAGLAGAAGKKYYDKHKADKRDAERDAERERELSEEEYERERRERERSRSRSRRDRDRSRSRSASRSRSRSRPHSSHHTAAAADPELGLVEYGGHPLYSEPPSDHGYAGPPPVDAAEERRRRRAARLARQQRERNRSRGRSGDSADDDTYDSDKRKKRARSKSRLRDLATGAVAAGAAAIGVKKFEEQRKEKEKKRAESREREESRETSISREAREQRRAERDRARREREKIRNSYEDSVTDDTQQNYDPYRPPSPPTASGGAYYGPPQTPPPVREDPPPPGNATFAQGFTQHPNVVSTNLNQEYRAYNPQDYASFPGPPPGPPPNSASTPTGMPPPPTGGHRPLDPDHVSSESSSSSSSVNANVNFKGADAVGGEHSKNTGRRERDRERPSDRRGDQVEDGLNDLNQPRAYRSRTASPASTVVSARDHTPPRTPSPPPTSPSHVQWVPLSPQSSQTLLRHRATRSRENVDNPRPDDEQQQDPRSGDGAVVPQARRFRKRGRNPDPAASRPAVAEYDRDRPSSSGDDVEVLPDRFDTQGRPIDGGFRNRGGWTQRRGDFTYRSPRPGGPQVRGAWGVAGTDPEHVERVMRDVTGVLSSEMPRGMGGWLGLAGRLLGGAMAGAGGHAGEEEDEEDGARRRDAGEGRGGHREEERGVIGYGGGSEVSRDERGKGRRRNDDYGYNDDDENGEERRRRRRRRREVD